MLERFPMKEDYVLDIASSSVSHPNTPSQNFLQLPFYIEQFGHFYANPSYYTHREGMKSHLMIYTLSGCGQLIYEGIGYELTPNSVVAFDCDKTHFYHTQSDAPWEFLYCHYSGTAADLYGGLLNDNNLSVIVPCEHTTITEDFNSLLHLVQTQDPQKDLKICQTLLTLYTQLILSKKASSSARKHRQYTEEINQVIKFIQENYKQKLSTDDLASIAVLSKYHFIRIFKSQTGLSPYEFLINFRINQSKYLLRETTDSVSVISESVGFGDINNYIRYFKKLVGSTPGSYRRLQL